MRELSTTSLAREDPAQPVTAVLHAPLQQATPLEAVAAMASCRQQQPDAYVVHPAALDAATHTAAVFSTISERSSDTTAEAAAVTRIPVALAAFGAAVGQPVQGSGQQRWCSGALRAVHPDGSVVTDFNVTDAGAAHLSGFIAKVCSLRLHQHSSGSMSTPSRLFTSVATTRCDDMVQQEYLHHSLAVDRPFGRGGRPCIV